MLKSVVALTALIAAGSAQAATVLFSDGFEADTPMLAITTSLTNWTVEGNVDVVGMPNTFGITCDGNCVDLDGTRGPGAILSKSIAYSAGGTVTISFDLSGSQRSTASDSFNFGILFAPALFSTGGDYFLPNFGAGTDSAYDGLGARFFIGMEIAGSAPWTNYFYSFNPTAAGSFQVRFGTDSADNIGPLLDNVLVTQAAVPEPATWAMLIAGFGMVGFAMRRRRLIAA